MELVKLKSILKVNEQGIFQDSDSELANLLKPVGKIIQIYGYNNESHEINFRIKLFKNFAHSKKLAPVITKLLSVMTPISIHDTIKSKFKIITIADYHNGYKGRYSLLINEKGECAIWKDHFKNCKVVASFSQLKNIELALELISKKYYFYNPS